MSVDSALAKIATAEVRLRQTTITYPLWKQRVEKGYYQNVTTTGWWQAFDALDSAQADLVTLQEAPIAAAGITYLFGDED